MKLNINNFPDNLVSFNSKRIENATLLWFNTNEPIVLNGQKLDAKRILETFGYAMPDNQFFEDIEFCDKENKLMFAERYGGVGAGVNGGGARCGNVGHFQIKGIGKNPLAGNSSDHWHSYGGLNLVDAIYETINAAVFGKIFPVGVAKIHGIIITGQNTAILPGSNDSSTEERRSYGALLIREACIRPAHFFPSLHFTLKGNTNLNIIKDVTRVRNVNKSLACEFGDTKDFVVQISKYLANHANQFAFARVARISHGSISPSNMCLDGKWLDLTNTSFLKGGENTGGRIPFYDEPQAIMEMLEELIYTFSKYNRLNLNATALLNYYVEQYQAYFTSHIIYVIGVNYTDISDGVSNHSLILLRNAFLKEILSAKQATTQRAYKINNSDPVICLIEALFISTSNLQAANAKFSACLDPSTNSTKEITDAFSNIICGVYKNAKLLKITYRNFLIATAAIALKRALVPEYFFMGRLEGYIYELVKNSKEELFAKVIDDSINIADWAFDLRECLGSATENGSSRSCIIIFKTQQFSICFEPQQGRYAVYDEPKKAFSYCENFDGVISVITLRNYCLMISDYCFKRYLERLGYTLRFLEQL